DIFMFAKPYGLLRKPISQDRLFCLIDELSQKEQAISISTGTSKIKIALKSIMYIERQNRKTGIVTAADSFFSYAPLSEIAAQLDKNFIHIHNSFYVNYKYINTMSSGDCKLITGKLLPVSRKFAKEAKTQFLLLKGRCI
ncbi:MAG: LytTR family transcriptional regulator, partial [Ruminococcus sp.]|nr:LytTR family transcriptional regulator [Ruminococcus sp.]